ncbi:MAG: quinoprotein dehydrogenase-associated SoxYZ-like carrier [Gammaproteobacteria bacterium]
MKGAVKLIATVLAGGAAAVAAATAHANGSLADQHWNDDIRQVHFQNRPIIESDDVIQLHMPERAEDPTVVPVNIYAMMPQTEERYIKQVTLFIDKNPVPMAGRFGFTPKSGRADVSMRIRVAEKTPVRAIAELNDGTLYMSAKSIEASGGCSGPLPTDLDKALSRLGKMKLNVGAAPTADEPLSTLLRISHPNITGLQVTTGEGEYTPALFVETVKVSYGGDVVFSAETHISISADPTFGFYFMPQEGGEMVAEVTDSTGKTFTKIVTVPGRTL